MSLPLHPLVFISVNRLYIHRIWSLIKRIGPAIFFSFFPILFALKSPLFFTPFDALLLYWPYGLTVVNKNMTTRAKLTRKRNDVIVLQA
jgi:hypothetical protein